MGLNFNMSITCSSCNNSDEDQEHLFFNCNDASNLWDYVLPTLDPFLEPHPYRIYDLVLNKWPSNITYHKKLVALTLVQITMRALWVHRNLVRFASPGNKPSIRATWNSIKCNFTKAIHLQLNQMYPDELEKFKTRFCHTPRIIQLQNDELLYVRFPKSGQG